MRQRVPQDNRRILIQLNGCLMDTTRIHEYLLLCISQDYTALLKQILATFNKKGKKIIKKGVVYRIEEVV